MEGRMLTGWLKLVPNKRKVSRAGRLLTGLLKFSPKVRWVSVDGRVLTDWLNFLPKNRWLREHGRVLTDWLKQSPKVRWVSVDGRTLRRLGDARRDDLDRREIREEERKCTCVSKSSQNLSCWRVEGRWERWEASMRM